MARTGIAWASRPNRIVNPVVTLTHAVLASKFESCHLYQTNAPKKKIPSSAGTLPTHGLLFGGSCAGRLSIVVLPFANLSGDPAQDYLADALTDELITSLARIAGAFVIARNTAYTYKGKPVDVKAIGKDLYVLEGSVQLTGNRVRITAAPVRKTARRSRSPIDALAAVEKRRDGHHTSSHLP
jgi:hypothetical protein